MCKSCVLLNRLYKFEKTIRLNKFFNTWDMFCEQSIHEAVENGNAKDKHKEAFIGECDRCYDDKVVFKYTKGNVIVDSCRKCDKIFKYYNKKIVS